MRAVKAADSNNRPSPPAYVSTRVQIANFIEPLAGYAAQSSFFPIRLGSIVPLRLAQTSRLICC
jgi:hypothetical protein